MEMWFKEVKKNKDVTLDGPLMQQHAKPRCLKDINMNNLQINYRYNAKARMTTVLFNEWLDLVNKKYKHQNRKILLFVDNFSGHAVEEDKYENVKVIFFPPNLTSVVQPLDQGIKQAFKTKYRKQIIINKIHAIDTCTEMDEITVLTAINYCISAWSEITKATIKNCFRKAGFKADMYLGECTDNSVREDDLVIEQMWSKIKKTKNGYDFSYFQYVEIDKDLPSCETYSDADIVQSIIESKQAVQEIEEENATPTVKVNSNQALEHLKSLKTYFQANPSN
jgi:hypothetical protein